MAKSPERLAIKVMLPPCRMSFPHLFKPQETDNGNKYQMNMLFPPKTDLKKFEDALYDVYEDMFGKDSKKWPKGQTTRGPELVIRDCTEKEYEGYDEGWNYVKASSKDPVGIVDARRDAVTNEREVYGGRWCRASVTVVAYDNKSKGVGVYLNAVQLLDHAEQFGGRGPAKNDFEDWDGPSLSDDDRGTGTGTSVSRSRGEDREDDRDSRRHDTRNPNVLRRSRDDEPEDQPRGRDRDREDTRGRDRDTPADDRGTRRSREPESDRDDAVRGSRGRDDRARDDDRGRGRDRDTDDRPSGRRSRNDEEWN